ncbi:hypothetical protein B0H13DRAFT_1881500 [Mycena leptocephala]|nr:hypothetical protein B0H13DRAFT_1881500 [Mycena leptocephala]
MRVEHDHSHLSSLPIAASTEFCANRLPSSNEPPKVDTLPYSRVSKRPLQRPMVQRRRLAAWCGNGREWTSCVIIIFLLTSTSTLARTSDHSEDLKNSSGQCIEQITRKQHRRAAMDRALLEVYTEHESAPATGPDDVHSGAIIPLIDFDFTTTWDESHYRSSTMGSPSTAATATSKDHVLEVLWHGQDPAFLLGLKFRDRDHITVA